MLEIAKVIRIDLTFERDRVKRLDYTKAQRAKLLKLYDLVEAGKLPEAAKHIKKAFKYDVKAGCPETEFIGTEVYDLFHELSHGVDWFDYTEAKATVDALKVENTALKKQLARKNRCG